MASLQGFSMSAIGNILICFTGYSKDWVRML